MKRRYKKLLSVFSALCVAVPFVGCEADAEETAENGTNSSASASGAGTINATSVTASGADSATNETTITETDDDTNATQVVVVQKIPPTLPVDVKLSKPVEEVVKLAQSGVSETVVLLFIEKSNERFELDAADIVYLNDIGISATVLASMLNHDGADTDVLHDALSTNNVATATAPPPQTAAQALPNAAQAAQVEVSSNYVAAPQPQYGGTVVTDPNAQPQQQQVVVQQEPVVVQQQPAVVITQPAVTYSYFYNSLSPYGSWVYVTDYGWCWQPTIAVTHHGWRPYLHGGRWFYSDVGWYWHSDYSWGWAPFHYGRWYCAPRIGWVWTPDYVWGPSWVTWRRSRDYCGWAPLPPRAYVRPGVGFSYWGRDVGFSFSFGYSHDYYTFVPSRRFCDRRIVDHVVPTHNSVNIYKDSTVINNYIVGNNNTIINNGVGRDYVASHTRSEIPRVRVADAPASTGRVAPDRLVRQGTENVVYRPQRPAPSLVAAHEAAVERTRSEVARPSSADVTRRNMIASRPTAPAPVSPDTRGAELRATSPRGGSTPVTRTETARPQIARSSDIPTPVFGRPAPVRPEPDRSAEILRSRTRQETVRPGTTPSGRGIGSGTTTRASEIVRPGTPGRNAVPRFDQSSPATSGSVVRSTPQPSTRPGAPQVSTSPGSSGRSEIGRGSTGRPGVPQSSGPTSRSTVTPRPGTPPPSQRGTTPQQPNRSRIESGRPTTVVPSGQSGPAITAQSPGFARPGAATASPAATQSTPASSPQIVRQSQPVAQSPAFARPAPRTAQPAAPVVRPSVSTPAPSVVPSSSGSTWMRAGSQPVQRPAASVQAPVAARPNVISRSETFSRPSMPVQSSARPTVVQPQSVTPVQRPAMVRPQVSNPSLSAPPVRSAPSVSVRPSPVQRGSFQSAPPSTPVARPVSPSSGPSGRDSRGRIEIGR